MSEISKSEVVEAVFINGPRKGEVVWVDGDTLLPLNAEAAFDAAIDSAQRAAQKEREVTDRLNAARDDVRRLTETVAELRARVTQLEAQREADRAHLETFLTRVQLELERAELRSRGLPPAST